MYYLVYRITHKKSNQFYIGRHVTENIEDGYLGSGSADILKDKKNLIKEILQICETAEIMLTKEIEYISDNISNPLCVNMIIGDPSHGVIQHSQKSKIKISKGMRVYKENNLDKFLKHMSKAGKSLKGHKQSKEHKLALSLKRKGVPKSKEFKNKVSDKLKGITNRPRETLCKNWKITNIITKEIFIVEDRVKFCEQNNLSYSSFNVGTRNKKIYKKTWLCEKLL
jgi:hypothetical protein